MRLSRMIENVIFQDDDTEESVATRAPEADLLQNTNGNDEVIIIVDIRRIRRRSERKLFSCRAREISLLL